jgi:DNA-binding transcriptional MerR regulator
MHIDFLSTPRAASLVGCSSLTLLRWERLGLLSPKRSSTGDRLWTPELIEKAKQVKRSRAKGNQVEEVNMTEQ